MQFDRSYTHIDKSEWGRGPWQDEPDKVQWVDEETDLDCLIVRNAAGTLCGYVGIDESHPWFGVHYGDTVVPDSELYVDSPEGILEVHGGITFSDRCSDGPEDRVVCHVPLQGRTDKIWWFGFDCGHSHDYLPGLESRLELHGVLKQTYGQYRDIDYVVKQVQQLATQLKENQC